ncbi:hypothetical protein CBS101457_006757 [Exobasidium rhododendri]|nr:hypothetical protein CBS101457_006757 [Exobasidium rhododendri]
MSLHPAVVPAIRKQNESSDRADSEDLSRAIVAATPSGKQRHGEKSRLQEREGDADCEDEGESCLICLGEIIDRTVLPKCLHSLFCFDCILRWIGIHRRCPLCSTSIEGYVIHSIRSDVDYIRHYLPSLATTNDANESDGLFDPLRLQADLSQTEARRIRRQLQQRVGRDQSTRQSRSSSHSLNGTETSVRPRASTSRSMEWGERRVEERQRDAIANWDERLAFRRRVYRERLYCLHVGSNKTSKLSPPPSPSTIATSTTVESMLLTFIRRELLAYPLTNDVDFLSRYTINVLKTFDCKSSEAVDLIAEFVGASGAEHYCHEIYSFSRFVGEGSIQAASGKQRDKVKAFDKWAQYERSNARLRNNYQKNREPDKGEYSLQPDAIASTAAPTEKEQECESAALRTTVIKSRESLLQRLEGEMRSARDAAHPSRDVVTQGDKQINGDGNNSDLPFLEREYNLKEKLLLKRREAHLKEKAKQHLRMKRRKA